MRLSGRSLTLAQTCLRKWRLSSRPKKGRWNPKTLFDATWRRALLELSQGQPKEKVTLRALASFREAARAPGLEARDPWTLSQDYCAALETSLEALSRLALLKLSLPAPLQVSPELLWEFSSFQDESGALHRWTSVPKLSAEGLSAELHSWEVVGDCALSGLPLTLHLLELPYQRGGRLHSPWTRVWKHPVVAGVWRFQKADGSSLGPGWKASWFSEAPHSAEEWVSLLEKEGLASRLLQHFPLRELSPEQAKEEKFEILKEARRLEEVPQEFRVLPKSRGACDRPFPCPFQGECFALPSQEA